MRRRIASDTRSRRCADSAGLVPSVEIATVTESSRTVAGTTTLRDVGPYNYSHPVTAGWAGDKLVPYVTDDSAETGETAYVWNGRPQAQTMSMYGR